MYPPSLSFMDSELLLLAAPCTSFSVSVTFRVFSLFLRQACAISETVQLSSVCLRQKFKFILFSFDQGVTWKDCGWGWMLLCWNVFFLWMEAGLWFWLLVLKNCLGDQLSHSLAERMTHTSSALFGCRSLLQWIELVLIKYQLLLYGLVPNSPSSSPRPPKKTPTCFVCQWRK